MQSTWAVAAVVFAAALAGCTVSDPGGADESAQRVKGFVEGPGGGLFDAYWIENAVPFGDRHEHADPTHHLNATTPNFDVVGYDPQITDYYGRSAGGYGCSDTVEKAGRVLSVVHSFDTDVGFIINDVTDPAHPVKIGELAMSSAQVYDIALTEDHRFVLLSTSPFEGGPDDPLADPLAASPVMTFRDACTGEERVVDGPEAGLPFHAGVVLVDIQNPRNPVIVDFVHTPPWGHSVRTVSIDGHHYVTVTVLSLAYATAYYMFLEIQDLPTGPKMVPLSVYQHPDADRYARGSGTGHDGLIAQHPVTGKTLAYLAYGNLGLVILDMNDPSDPTLLSVYNDWSMLDAGVSELYIHGAIPISEAWDGRHYTLLGEECAGHRSVSPTCLVVVVDTTDPGEVSFVGAWTIPTDFSWTGPFQFSIHYYAIQNRTLFVSTYHGGLWAVDLSTPEALRTMPTIGVFLPTNESPRPSEGGSNLVVSLVFDALYPNMPWDNTPFVFDVNALGDGNLVVYDYSSGLYVVHFDEDDPAPPPAPWPLGYLE